MEVLCPFELIFLSSHMSVRGPENRAELITFQVSRHLHFYSSPRRLQQLVEPFLRLGLIRRALLDLVLGNYSHHDVKRGNIDHCYRNCVYALGLGYTFMYDLLCCRIRGGTSESLRQGSVNDRLDHRYLFRFQH